MGNAQEMACLAIFESVHDVMACESTLKREGIGCAMVPTPRDLSSDCGMALSFACADLEPIRKQAAAGTIRVAGLYSHQDGGYSQLALSD